MVDSDDPTTGDGRRGRTSRTSSVLRPIPFALLAVLILFGAYEIAERTWLRDAEVGLLHVLHRLRGAAAALIAAAVATWLIAREGPPLLAAGPLPEGLHPGGGDDAGRKRLHYARWLILMRWIAVVVAAVAVVAAVEVAELLPHSLAPALGGTIAALALLNLGYGYFLRLRGASTAFLVVQTYVDVFVLILLLHFAGGIENPLSPLLLLHVIIAGIVLGRLHSYLVAGLASTLFALLAWSEWAGVLPHYTLTIFPHGGTHGHVVHAAHDALYAASRAGLQAVILFLVAYFTTTLVDRIRQDERQLETLADRALAQAQTLERALDTTGTALCLCDRALRPFWTNARWTEWAGEYPELTCSGGSRDSAAGSTLRDGQVRSREVRITGRPAAGAARCAEAGERVLHLTTAPLRDRDGQISHVVTLARDVTEQHLAQVRAVRAERLAAVGELAGQVAHEVNNPVAIISAKARLLMREGREVLPERATVEIAKIAELADRVARIAQGLLSYCRPAPGARSRLDLRIPLRRALAYVETRANGAGVRIRDELPEQLPEVEANAAELEQVFLNVFLNALDAMPDGGELRVCARCGPNGAAGARTMVNVQVADTGGGIAPEIRDRVFEPFLTTKGGRGSGLGLSICQGLVRSHAGVIEIESEPGCGTRVTVQLPVAAAPRPEPATSRAWGGRDA